MFIEVPLFPKSSPVLKNFWLCACLWWLLLIFFIESQKGTVFSINGSALINVLSQLILHSICPICSIWYSECTTQLETIFFSVDFLVVRVYQNFLFTSMQKKQLLLMLIPFGFYSSSLFLLFYSPLAWISNLILI